MRSLTGQLIAADSVSSTGGFSTLVRTFRTRLPVTTSPTVVTIAGFARNANGRRDVTRYASGALRVDTVAVVAGYTNPLPNGGKVADALYFPRNDRLYLTNIDEVLGTTERGCVRDRGRRTNAACRSIGCGSSEGD